MYECKKCENSSFRFRKVQFYDPPSPNHKDGQMVDKLVAVCNTCKGVASDLGEIASRGVGRHPAQSKKHRLMYFKHKPFWVFREYRDNGMDYASGLYEGRILKVQAHKLKN